MENSSLGTRRKGKILKIIGISLLALVIILCLAVAILFGGEIATVMTVRQVGDTDLFIMDYKGDYGLDDFIKQGASSDGELVAFMSRRMLKGFPLNFDLPELGCSTFYAKTPDNSYIFGRNFDNKYTPVLVLTTKPKDGYSSISTVNLSFIGYNKDFMPDKLLNRILALASPYAPLDGLNERGVSIGVLQLSTPPTVQNSGKTNITTTAAIRLVLDKAASVDEALTLLQQFDMRSSAGASYHFQITDASGRSVVVEYLDDVFTVLETDCCTNFILAPGAWYNNGGGQERYAILQQTLQAANGVLTEKQGMDLLQAVCQINTATPTQWSVVYDNTNNTAQFCLHMFYDAPYLFGL